MEPILFQTASLIVREGEERRIKLRLFGAIACWNFAQKCRDLPAFHRARNPDIDFVSNCNSEDGIADIFLSHGFKKDPTDFYQSGFKMNFRLTKQSEVTAHVWSGRSLSFNHPMRISVACLNGSMSLNPTDLFLTKIAIHYFTEKDKLDCSMMLHDLPIDTGDSSGINSEIIAARCAAGWRAWGLFTDVCQNLQTVIGYVERRSEFSAPQRAKMVSAATTLAAKLNTFPKSAAWRIRARLGRFFPRIPWFDEVDDTE